MGDALECAATDEDGTDGINEIVHGVDIGGQIGPRGHATGGRKQTAEQHETHHEEPHDEHGLLHGVAVVGNNESERREEQGQQYGQQIDEEKRPLARDAIDQPRQDEADGEHQQTDKPIGYQFCQDKRPFGDWRDVDLLDGALLLLAHNVQGRQESAEHHHQYAHQGGNHEDLIVLTLVV